MTRPVKNFILAALMISAVCVAGFSSVSTGESAASIRYENQTSQSVELSTGLEGLNNIEIQSLDFWDKFRDSVMPDEQDKPNKQEPPKEVKPKPAEPPKTVTPRPA